MYAPPSLSVPAMVSPYLLHFGIPPQMFPAPSSAAWVEANAAHYLPILLDGLYVVRRVWWVNGSSVSASYNLDCGVYADAGYKPGTRLVSSGSTAQGTASEVQFANVTDTTLAPGLYWLALSCSSASATTFRSTLQGYWDAATQFVEASALPLPATATPAEALYNVVPFFGFATTASP